MPESPIASRPPVAFLTSSSYPLGPVPVAPLPLPPSPPDRVGPIRLALNTSSTLSAERQASWDRLLASLTPGDRTTLRQMFPVAVAELDEPRLLQYAQQALRATGDTNEQQYERLSAASAARAAHAPTFASQPAETSAQWLARLTGADPTVLWTPLLDQAASQGLLTLPLVTPEEPEPEHHQVRLQRHLSGRAHRVTTRFWERPAAEVAYDLTLADWPQRRAQIEAWARTAPDEDLCHVLSHTRTPQVRHAVLSQIPRLTPALIEAAVRAAGYAEALAAHPDLAHEPLATHVGLSALAAHQWNTQATLFDQQGDHFVPAPVTERADYLDTETRWLLERLAYRPHGLPTAVRDVLVGALNRAMPAKEEFQPTRYATVEQSVENARRDFSTTWVYHVLLPDPLCPKEWVEAIRGNGSYQTPSQPRLLLRRLANPYLSPSDFEKGRNLFEHGTGFSSGITMPPEGFWQPWQFTAFIARFTPQTDIELFRRAASRTELDDAGGAILLQRIDDEAVRDALAANPVARRLPVVRAALGRCRVPLVLRGLIESATPEEFENLWPRLTKSDPEVALAILQARTLSPDVVLHPQHLRPLLVSKDPKAREQAIRLMGELEMDPSAPRPKARSPRQAARVAAQPQTPPAPAGSPRR